MLRRDFLLASMLGLGTCSLAINKAFANMTNRVDKPSFGAQLYTARNLMSRDVRATLESIAALGYSEFEFAGYFDLAPTEIRKILDDLGAIAPSAHLGADAFVKDFAKALDDASILGHRYLVLPWWDEGDRSIGGYQRLAELLSRSAEAAAAHGIKVAYHNHDFEFESLNGLIPYELLLAETQSEQVYFELDLYWCAVVGRSPLALFADHPGRFPLLHLKDRDAQGSMTDVGSGELDFAAVLAKSTLAGVEHTYVERDDATDPMVTFRKSLTYLSGL